MRLTTLLGAAAALLISGQALASPVNVDEPLGTKIDDLNGGAISHDWTHVTTSFVAGTTATDVGFAFRDDPAFIYFDNVSVTLGAGPNLAVNGGFETGDLTGWTYQNPNNAAFAGFVQSGSGNPGFAWFDGSVQAYDTLDQSIATVMGQTYTVSFDYKENSGDGFFSRLSTNGDTTTTGGNGINIVVYAGQGRPVLQSGTPEPATWGLMLVGFGGLGAMMRRRRAAALA